MTVTTPRKILRWMLDHMLWDTAGRRRQGILAGPVGDTETSDCFRGIGCADWWEWVEHHPPDMVFVAIIHFVFVFLLVALLVYLGQWLRARKLPTSQTPHK